jgi:uncharacterized protein DUF4255/IPT/TIG domain-containing protein
MLEEVNRDIAGIKITTRPLDAIEIQNPVNGLNIFLYLVAPTPAVDAIDTLVNDKKTGQPINNPTLALDLHYIITATSSENDDLVAQKILASAMRILNNHPVMTRDTIRKAVRNKEGLEASDLAEQIDDVRLILNGLSTEDLTKIWSRFPNANFRSSVAYVAQVIILESKLVEPTGSIGSIALDRIGQLKSPSIQSIEPQILEYSSDASIVITGSNMKAPAVSVGFGDNIVTPLKAEMISDTRVSVPIPAEIEPGILRVRIYHFLGTTKDEQIAGKRSMLQSNESPFVLAPRILTPRQGKVSSGSDLTVEFEPRVSKGQPIFVYLGDNAYAAAPIKDSETAKDSKVGSVKLAVPQDLTPGVFLLRLAVDGATSLVEVDDNPRSTTFRKPTGPYVEIK